jgi:hypothetical protein
VLVTNVDDIDEDGSGVSHVTQSALHGSDFIEISSIRMILPPWVSDPNIGELEPEVAVDIASDPAVGANNFLDFLLNEKIVRINVSM